ncbi:MAG TPA: hypothetical protein VF066_12750 [Thermoleophilaceae bacterium]
MRRIASLAAAVVMLAAFAQPAGAAEQHRWPKHIATWYEMFSPAGDRAVRHVVWRASRGLKAGWSRKRVMARVRRDYRKVENKYEEAYDTAVCEAFADELDRWLDAAGYEPIDALDEFAFTDDEVLEGLGAAPTHSDPTAA